MITSSSPTSSNTSYLNSNSPTPILNFTMITYSSLTSSKPYTNYLNSNTSCLTLVLSLLDGCLANHIGTRSFTLSLNIDNTGTLESKY